MTHYIILWKFASKKIRNLDGCPRYIENCKKKIEEMGGKFVGTYYTTGKYGAAAIVEAPDDTVMNSILLPFGSEENNAKTVTLRILTAQEMDKFL